MNVLVGGLPLKDKEEKQRVKAAVMTLLYDKYKITEKDFISAEFELVPAHKAKDIGFDRSLSVLTDRTTEYALIRRSEPSAISKRRKRHAYACFQIKKRSAAAEIRALSQGYMKTRVRMLLAKCDGTFDSYKYYTCIENSKMLHRM